MPRNKISAEQSAFEKALMTYIGKHKQPVAPKVIWKITRYLTMREKQLLWYATLKSNGKATKYHHDYYANIEKCTKEYIQKHIGCRCEIQDDPRGMQIRLYIKDNTTNYFFNNFDGESAGVNWIHTDE